MRSDRMANVEDVIVLQIRAEGRCIKMNSKLKL